VPDPPTSGNPSSDAVTGETVLSRRLRAGWRGKLTTTLVGAAGGMAINDFSGTLGYRAGFREYSQSRRWWHRRRGYARSMHGPGYRGVPRGCS
jgi:hypothetical protein